MKKLTLSILIFLGLCLSYAGSSMTVNISGTVTDISNGAPISNHAVVIYSDTLIGFTYNNTVYTNSSGFYTVSIPNVNPQDSVMFIVKTQDCASVWHTQTVSGNTTPITVNFQICTGTPPPLITVTISGTIYEAGTTIPVPNHAVTVSADSSSGFFYYNTTYTNTNGFYTVTINNVPNNTFFSVTTYDCSNVPHTQSVNGNNTPITVNFYICVTPPPPTGTMWGHVFAGSNFAEYGKVDLIQSINDSLFVVDTKYIDSTGGYSFYNVAVGNYMIFAELSENSVYYGQYAPTFYIASLYWTGATIIQQGASTNQYDIHLVAAPGYAPGSGNIGGNIQQGLKSSAGTPVQSMEVLLLDQNNQVLAFTKTDLNGNYSFPNIAYGTYIVYPQKLAINTTPATVTLTSSDPNANVNFLLENGTIFTGIKEKENYLESDITVFPNPVKEKCSILLNTNKELTLTLQVVDLTGRTCLESVNKIVKGENKISFSANSLQNGVYFIKLITNNETISSSRIILNK